MLVEPWPSHNYGLVGDALLVAQGGVIRYGADAFEITSGKRTREDQAAAMAANEWRSRGWIAATYVDSKVKRAIVRATERAWSGAKCTRQKLQTAILLAMNVFTDVELGALTLHMAGMAFDVRPRPEKPAIAVYLAAEALRLGGKFLDREGGLLRYHWQAKRL
jgi:hypothetical protein